MCEVDESLEKQTYVKLVLSLVTLLQDWRRGLPFIIDHGSFWHGPDGERITSVVRKCAQRQNRRWVSWIHRVLSVSDTTWQRKCGSSTAFLSDNKDRQPKHSAKKHKNRTLSDLGNPIAAFGSLDRSNACFILDHRGRENSKFVYHYKQTEVLPQGRKDHRVYVRIGW